MSSGAVGRVGGPVVVISGPVVVEVEGARPAPPTTAHPPAEGPKAASRGFEDLVVEGTGDQAPQGMGDLLDSLARGVPFELAIIQLKQKLALDEARETTVSNLTSAYQRIAMSVIGNLKA